MFELDYSPVFPVFVKLFLKQKEKRLNQRCELRKVWWLNDTHREHSRRCQRKCYEFIAKSKQEGKHTKPLFVGGFQFYSALSSVTKTGKTICLWCWQTGAVRNISSPAHLRSQPCRSARKWEVSIGVSRSAGCGQSKFITCHQIRNHWLSWRPTSLISALFLFLSGQITFKPAEALIAACRPRYWLKDSEKPNDRTTQSKS